MPRNAAAKSSGPASLPVRERSYRARTIKRFRRTGQDVEALDQQIISVLQEDHPQSVRHVFYRLTDPRLACHVEKSDRGYRHVQGRLVKLREAGRVPYGWIADATRRGYFVSTFSSAGNFVERMASLYRADLWQHADSCCEVWVESRSLGSVIQPLCNELAVDLYPSGGFASLSFIYDAAKSINAENDGRPLRIFYIGDYDPAGVLIDKKIEQGIRSHLDADVDMTFERIGITLEQIKQYDLPQKPRKEGDKRSPEVEFTVEAEAMPARILRALLRGRIEALLPANALQVAKVAEESEREGLRMMARLFEDDSDG